LKQYDQANEQFRIAIAQPDAPALYKVRWGMLLHERFNNTNAVGLFKEALEKDPSNAQAYYGLAVVSADGFDGKAKEYAAHAIQLDPKYVAAHVLMASLMLEDDDTKKATAEADEALKLDADAMDAMAIHTTIELNADRSPNA
jgi:tetratricopeptide (TPR) repeat protein